MTQPGSHAAAAELDDRTRLAFIAVTNAILAAAVVVAVLCDAFRRPSGVAVDVGDMTLVLVLEGTVVVVAAVTAGLARARLLWAGVLYQLARVNDNDELFKRVAELRSAPVQPASRRDAIVLRLLVLLMGVAIVLLTSRTGGLTASPFLPMGLALFVLGMLLTKRIYGRLTLGLLAVATLVAAYAAGIDGESGLQVDHRVYAVLVLVTLLVQLVVVAAGAKSLELTGWPFNRRAPSAGSRPSQATGATEPFSITHANWGTDGTNVDVTQIVSGRVVDGRLDIEASNDLFGDPIFGEPKRLVIEYALHGSPGSVRVSENERVVLPPE